jgi:hypothetical protein
MMSNSFFTKLDLRISSWDVGMSVWLAQQRALDWLRVTTTTAFSLCSSWIAHLPASLTHLLMECEIDHEPEWITMLPNACPRLEVLFVRGDNFKTEPLDIVVLLQRLPRLVDVRVPLFTRSDDVMDEVTATLRNQQTKGRLLFLPGIKGFGAVQPYLRAQVDIWG